MKCLYITNGIQLKCIPYLTKDGISYSGNLASQRPPLATH